MEDNTLDTYELKIAEDDATSGVFAVSLVDTPAIETNWISLSKVENRLQLFSNTDKKELVGPLIIPDLKIYRKDGRGEYNAIFSKATIKMAQEKFFKAAYNSKTTHQHQVPLYGNTVIESWIIEDTKNDKSNIYNFNLPEGTWMIKVKVNDENYWNEYVKSGKVQGFSLEGFFQENFIKNNEELMSIKKEKFALMQPIFKLGDLTLEISDSNELVIQDSGSKMPSGKYDTDEGYCIVVNEKGKVVSMTTPESKVVYVEEFALTNKKNVAKRMKKKSKMREILSALKTLGYNFQAEEVEEVVKEEMVEDEVIEEMEDDLITSEISFPAEGGEFEVETEMGSFKITVEPLMAEAVTDSAETREPVESPIMEVSQLKSQIEKLTKELESIKNVKAKPVVAKKVDEFSDVKSNKLSTKDLMDMALKISKK